MDLLLTKYQPTSCSGTELAMACRVSFPRSYNFMLILIRLAQHGDHALFPQRSRPSLMLCEGARGLFEF